jgi:hypothetical protein
LVSKSRIDIISLCGQQDNKSDQWSPIVQRSLGQVDQ